MSIEIKIPKEVRKYEAKLIGPFTLRQLICILIGLPIELFLYNFLKKYLPGDAIIPVCLIPPLFMFLFGWCKIYGMTFERFLKSAFISSFVAPSKRKYRTKNFYLALANEIEKAERLEEEQNNKKKRKYRRSRRAIK